MEATTIKLEGEMLQELKRLKKPSESVSSLVRDILEGEIRRRKMADAAERYARFLVDNPKEAEAMAVWEKAPLYEEPRKKGK